MAIRCGTCAWADHHGFYPESLPARERLSFYAKYFSIVEVDSTFYGIPKPASAVHWVAATPDHFVFDVKAYRTLTRHDRGRSSKEEWTRDAGAFRQVADVLKDAGKLGALLFQFPPWFVRTRDHQAYIETLREMFPDYRFAVEFRHRSWWMPEVREDTVAWLQQQAFVNVVCDEPQVGMGTIPFEPQVTNPELVIFRLHGRNGEMWYKKGLTSSQERFDYLYSREELAAFLPVVQDWTVHASEVHILMNNNQADYAVSNALDWLSLLGQPVPERPSGPSQQLTLF
ncbi:MAG: DUF72 domain-containing protein [Alicyclobacillus sp.]|nr:DUF72 domain-containing protein [Alicyclobacillus sp.]